MKSIFLIPLGSLLLLTACKPLDFTNATVQKIDDLQGFPKQGYQGMAIYKDYLVSLQNTGLATIYRLHEDSLELLSQFPLASQAKENHANVAFFGTERYDPSDEFPLLYISQCSKQRYRGMKDVCLVERISLAEAPRLKLSLLSKNLANLANLANFFSNPCAQRTILRKAMSRARWY